MTFEQKRDGSYIATFEGKDLAQIVKLVKVLEKEKQQEIAEVYKQMSSVEVGETTK